jgi:hypothetical protein
MVATLPCGFELRREGVFNRLFGLSTLGRRRSCFATAWRTPGHDRSAGDRRFAGFLPRGKTCEATCCIGHEFTVVLNIQGTSRDAAGADRSNDFLAQQVLDAVSQGRSVRLPNLFASVAADGSDPRLLESAAALAGKSQWVLSTFEASGADHAAGLLGALEYLDKLMFRGWLRPERAGLESKHGNRADAAIHTDTGLLDSELIDQDFAFAVNQQLVNPLLVANFGPAARDAVVIEPNPMADDATETNRKILEVLLANPEVAPSVFKKIDVDAMLVDLAVPAKPNP